MRIKSFFNFMYKSSFEVFKHKNIDLVKDESQKDLDKYLELFIGYKLKINKANKLGLHSMDFNPETVVLYIPRQDRKIRIGKSPFFQEVLPVVGAVDYNKEVNEQVLITDLTFAQDYFNKEVSGLLIATDDARRNTIKELLSERFPQGFIIETNLEKNALIFKTSRSEKLIVIIILVFIFIFRFHFFATIRTFSQSFHIIWHDISWKIFIPT